MKQQAGGEMSDREAPVVKGFGSGEGLRVKQLWFSFVCFDSQLKGFVCEGLWIRSASVFPQDTRNLRENFNHFVFLE